MSTLYAHMYSNCRVTLAYTMYNGSQRLHQVPVRYASVRGDGLYLPSNQDCPYDYADNHSSVSSIPPAYGSQKFGSQSRIKHSLSNKAMQPNWQSQQQ